MPTSISARFICTVAASLTLLALPGYTSPAPLRLQRIITLGDPVGDAVTANDASLGVGPLNDRGQLCFSTESDSAGMLLIQYADSRLTLVAEAGGDGPIGKWPDNLWFDAPVCMNQDGDILFSGLLVSGSAQDSGGTFLWSYPEQRVTAVALPGMPSVGDQKFEWAAGPAPALNDRGGAALVGLVRNSAGRGFYGIFLHASNGGLTPVAVPDQTLPDGKKIISAYQPSLRDDGTFAFLMQRQGDALELPFTWGQGVISPVPITGVKQRGKLLIGFDGVWANNRNRSVLVAAQLHALSGHYSALFLITGDKTTPVALPGQDMPGGGKLRWVQLKGVSLPNDAGQHAFLASLDNGDTAAYLMQPDGSLSLLLKSGMATTLGKVTTVGLGNGDSWGIGLNNLGQVALTVSLGGGPDTLVLLPAAGG